MHNILSIQLMKERSSFTRWQYRKKMLLLWNTNLMNIQPKARFLLYVSFFFLFGRLDTMSSNSFSWYLSGQWSLLDDIRLLSKWHATGSTGLQGTHNRKLYLIWPITSEIVFFFTKVPNILWFFREIVKNERKLSNISTGLADSIFRVGNRQAIYNSDFIIQEFTTNPHQ